MIFSYLQNNSIIEWTLQKPLDPSKPSYRYEKNANDWKFENLDPGQHYEVYIRGIIRNAPLPNQPDVTTPPAKVEFYTELDPIRDFDTTKITTNSISLRWTGPIANITHYQLRLEVKNNKNVSHFPNFLFL